jgi:hypothetical protein
MARHTPRTVLILILAFAATAPWTGVPTPKPPAPEAKADDAPGLSVKLGEIPDLRLTPRPPITEAKAKRIKALIASLADLDMPDFGLSATLSGDAFSPVPGQGGFRTGFLTDHRIEPSVSLRALVSHGPDALPFLLDALDDRTPTKITVKHQGLLGGMWHQGELFLSPANPFEEGVYKAREATGRGELDLAMSEGVESYTVKVGDVCFVAIGQIVGRGYAAVRYQPTMCIVLNCPSHDPKLCAEVRAIWEARDARRRLFDSLRVDYATEGVFNGESLDGWSLGSELQCGAALRLLYYFPEESAPLIARRLDLLDVREDKELESWMRRCVANGVRADDFVKAVGWSEESVVRAAVRRLAERTGKK